MIKKEKGDSNKIEKYTLYKRKRLNYCCGGKGGKGCLGGAVNGGVPLPD
jgi:hypothetical protein